jgi:hypothetical protein
LHELILYTLRPLLFLMRDPQNGAKTEPSARESRSNFRAAGPSNHDKSFKFQQKNEFVVNIADSDTRLNETQPEQPRFCSSSSLKGRTRQTNYTRQRLEPPCLTLSQSLFHFVYCFPAMTHVICSHVTHT